MQCAGATEWLLWASLCILRPDSLTPAGRSVNSSELVPGDVYELSDPSLLQPPADSLLLAGDCIINESMLTGLRLRFALLMRC